MKDISVVFSGEAGQGIKTLEKLLLSTLREVGFYFFSTSEVMSRVRGGNNTTEIRISSEKVSAFVERIDLLVPLAPNSLYRLTKRISKDTYIAGDKSHIEENYQNNNFGEFPISELIKKVGGKIYANIAVFGMVLRLLNIDIKIAEKIINKQFSKKGETILNKNLNALKTGFENAPDIDLKNRLPLNPKAKGQGIFSGNDAIGLGAISGGCSFLSSYPMSPATGVLTFLASKAKDFEIVVEQAEDEIAAINMAIGASYAGARGFATTSGGGFALMEEGISLAGITETPVVVHLAQRPGPATGLPTRTEQGDLLFAAFSGHGEFPKLIYAPGSIKEGIELTHKAFNMADKYGIPVIIMTDQYFLDSSFLEEKVDLNKLEAKNYFIETDKNYKTYEITKNGISPRGVPSFGTGNVCCDSDEHDEWGRITEDAELRVKMMDKRMKKIETLKQDVTEPELIGDKNYDNLIVGWGSTYLTIKEALENIKDKKTAFLHLKQVYPLPHSVKNYLKKAKNTTIVENNATGQLAKLIRMETGLAFNKKILQYDGFPFSVERLVNEFSEK